MKYVKIEGVDMPVSKIVCGTACAPYSGGGDCSELLNGVLSLGVNTFDTARVYGGAERALGKWISSCGVRKRIVLVTKCCHPGIFGFRRVNARSMRADLKKSLKLLNTEYIDIFLLHRDDPSVPAGIVVEELNALRAEGKVRAFGVSNWTHARIAEANEYAAAHGLTPFCVSSPDFSLAERLRDIWGGGVSISGSGGAAAREWYARSGMCVMAYSSLARGLLSGKVGGDMRDAARVLDRHAVKGYLSAKNLSALSACKELAGRLGITVAQAALAYVLNQKFTGLAVVSCSRLGRMKENAAAADIALSAEQIAFLEGNSKGF